ncbi:bifunctional (p)ppGpp synthetase/guanosine-3',5'-bis(diphosphate) 3'-pyrophosphohydrolase [Desulfobacterales bacterium HSG17]|nr:bifunctional (p)ppGpp synthetase/guanosine-3',5'-bis(diphosphate) 3'-pyrophosphohydrolase [Desulfobacterales bacterium HSG17]
MVRITDIIDKVMEYAPDADLDLIDRAYIFSARVHDGQVRLSGEPYLSHPLEVANILAEMKLDPISISSALLHDVVEDTHATEKEIAEMFGEEVRHIVTGVTKISSLPIHTGQSRQAESLRKMILAMADDIRVILIKLVDRVHNMRTLQFHKKEEKKRQIAEETLAIYAPIASRLGIYWIKNELEDASFFYSMPEEHTRIQSLIDKDQGQGERYIATVRQLIQEKMGAANMQCDVLGRYKHLYSIYHKMQTQNLRYDELYDIIAFRIVLSTIPQCYEALGILHALWKPIPNKFKDYIGNPKPNMYQSLHTSVIGPYGERMEIQIRTSEMDGVARSGIAAHWSYKEGRSFDAEVVERFAWIQDLVENQENTPDPDEFLENVRIDLFPDDVYVFTPQGHIKTLPKGATPIDFAFAIHTEVGHTCVGAKVNGRMTQLSHELATGDTIEVITAKNHHPSKDWLNFAKTVKARGRIRQWIKNEDMERSLSLGREMCEKAFRKEKLNFNEIVKSGDINKAITELGYKKIDDLIANVGYGKVTPRQIINKIRPKTVGDDSGASIINKIMEKVRRKRDKGGVLVKGVDDILIRFGNCCQPVPGDAITGYITRGSGVAVHRTNCVNALKMNPDRRIEVSWNVEGVDTYPVKVRVRAADRVGLLADLAVAVSKIKANILSANTETFENRQVDCFFSIEVSDTKHLREVMAALRRVKQVQGVYREK